MSRDHLAHLVHQPDLLLEDYVPAEVAARELQVAQLRQALGPALQRRKPVHVWLHGNPGTGKTVTARWVTERLWREGGLKGLYLNCWRYPTYFSILDLIVRELRILGAERLTVSFKLERLSRHLDDTPMVVVLDEIDQLSPKDRNSTLYNLSQVTNVGLVCVCNSESVYFGLEERIKSRLNPVRIHFADYSPAELLTILQRRAFEGLGVGCCPDTTLAAITDLARGDARLAIKTLLDAAMLAQLRHDVAVRPQHVKGAWRSARELTTTHRLARLTDHHRLLHELIVENPGVHSGDLRRLYLHTCAGRHLTPIAPRTFSDYCNKLAEVGAIIAKRAAIQGKVREFSASM
jgi:cell division control protein 6